ncbi:hypothetical protein [Mycolicibacter longobardus]|nr:hypothetical protein [Mycolicibacter longobardus]
MDFSASQRFGGPVFQAPNDNVCSHFYDNARGHFFDNMRGQDW